MLRCLLTLLLWASWLAESIPALVPDSLYGFSCQGTSYRNALQNCPDKGGQKLSSGGNVTVTVKAAYNLPNMDFSGPAAGVSDPYVRFTIGDVVAESKFIRNTLNPVWNQDVNLGLFSSGTEIIVEIWDYDIGVELGDDLLVRSSMRVPFCSMFHANLTKVDCGQPFGCQVDDSSWAMPTRLQCNESGIVSFVAGTRCFTASGICLFIDVVIVPFQMSIDLVNSPLNIGVSPRISAFGMKEARAPWTVQNGFANPIIGDSSTFLDSTLQESAFLSGALMVQFQATEKAKGRSNYINFYASVNFPATIYVCRSEADNRKGIPTWITSEYSSQNVTAYKLALTGTSVTFGCFFKKVLGTVKNRFGGIKSAPLVFHTNTIPGHDSRLNLDLPYYQAMYVVLAIPKMILPPDDDFTVIYDEAAFINTVGSYGLIWFWFMYLVARFLRKIEYRIDRIESFLSSRVLTGEHKSILGALFLNYQQTPCNVEHRAHLFHAKNAILLLLAMPLIFLVGWGFSCVSLARPTALGFGVAFVGMASVFMWFGFRRWEKDNWRLSPISVVSMGLAVFLFFLFIISIIFIDAAVVTLNRSLNVAALSLLFGTLNTMPLLLVIFRQDRNHKKNLQAVLEKMTDAVCRMKKTERRGEYAKCMKANTLLHSLLGAQYTINPKVSFFKFAVALQDPAADQDTAEARDRDAMYDASLFILSIYLIIALVRTDYPSLAFLNCLAVLTFDVIHTSLANGDNNWSPGYKIVLLIVGRAFVMGSTPSMWLVTYSGAYLVYAIALIQEIINSSLPMLSKREAGEVAFAGKDDINTKKSPDIAGTPFFCFGWLTFVFVCLLLVSAYGNVQGALPVPKVNVANTPWPVYAFGLIAILFVITGGLLSATIRAFYLHKHGLLRGWARDAYMMKTYVNTPIILALFSELAIITSGVIIYAITKSAAVLTVCIFLPLIVLCLGHAYREWVKNDYDLVKWPPKDAPDSPENDNPSDLEVAFHMIENLFGEEAAPETTEADEAPMLPPPEEKKLKGFKLPVLESTGNKVETAIKMPPLPLKSVLRRKRANLGISVKQPAVQDLRGREGADTDKFGDGNDTLTLESKNDIWAQFGDGEDPAESEKIKAKKRKEKLKREALQAKPRGGFLNHPRLVILLDTIKQNKYFMIVSGAISPYVEVCMARMKKYSKVGVGEEDEDEEEKDGEDGDGEKKNKVAPKSENLSKMNFWHAFFGGYLSGEEYKAAMSWFVGMFAIMMMGVTLANTVAPTYLGHVIWVSVWMFIITSVIIVKYFHTFKVDDTMKQLFAFMCVFHFMFTFAFFGAELNGDIGLPGTLWITDFFFYFPAFLYMYLEFYQWREDNYIIIPLDEDGDGDVTAREYLEYFKGQPFVFVMMIILNWQFYLWIGILFGQICTLALLVGAFGYLFIRDWAINDFFLSPEYTRILGIIVQIILGISLMVAVFSNQNPLFALSVFFFTFIFRSVAGLATRFMISDPDMVLFFSPTFMPVYSYDPTTNDVHDESQLAKELLGALLMGALWGACMCAFLYPVNIGIAIACSFLQIIAAVIATAVSYVPLQLGKYQSMLASEGILEAAKIARENFQDRRIPLKIEMKDFEGENTGRWTEKKAKSMLDKLKEKQAIEIASESISETRALYMVQDDLEYVQSQVIKIVEEEGEVPWYLEYWTQLKEQAAKLFELMPTGHTKGWRKHSEALFDISDAMAESIVCGKGPMGWLGVDGYLFKLFKMAQEYPRLKFLQQPWLNAYDEFGNNKNSVPLGEHCETNAILARYRDIDTALSFTHYEETRCAVHFLLLLVVGAKAKMQREQVLFQKFLRENRFRLASNGISPPAEIFTSSSFSSIDIPLVAVWLSTLSSEERERFHMLKATFSDEQRERDLQIDAADRSLQEEADFFLREREEKDAVMVNMVDRQMASKREERINLFSETLHPMERTSFLLRREEWMNNADCYVHFKEQALYDKFRAACMQDREESVEYGRMVLKELEAGLRDCRLGEYGRTYQFVDSEFPPGDASVGEGGVASQVLGWRCSPGVVDEVKLFRHGSDPSDVNMGIFDNAWLLSAISMLAAAGGGGNHNGKPVSQVENLFVGHFGSDGELTFQTEVGAYCIRLFRQGVWNPIVVDDLLPMLLRENWTNENRGMACAHSSECSSIWVTLIEKAVAKFCGSYADLGKGYVHHALTDLTGAESECLPLAAASRGSGKRALWDQILKYKRNGYIIGCGTGSSALVDKEITDMGIVFNAAYPIYDAWYIDGHQIIKLHNPPGSFETWKGDWSHDSSLWNARLKHKLGYDENDRGAFYMAFDDFCNVFRYLYVCKYYDKNKWTTATYPGFWQKSRATESSDAAGDANSKKKKKKGKESIAGTMEDDSEMDAEKREAAIAKVDTAGGLPSVDNPGCMLENNPYYSLKIFRPTDVRLSISQTDSRGKVSGESVPFSAFIVRNPHETVPTRLTTLSRDDIIAQMPDVTAERERNIYVSLKPGLYIILIGTYVAGMEGKFSVSLSTNYRATFEPLWPPKWLVAPGAKTNEDVMKDLARKSALEASKGLRDLLKYLNKARKEIFGSGGGEKGAEGEEDEDDDDDDDEED